MSNENKHETVADIVAEMKNGPCCWLTPEGIPQHHHDNELFSVFADRIEAASKREVDRLRAALKPVLEIYLSYEDGEPIRWGDGEACTDSEWGVSVNGKPIDDHALADCLDAVRRVLRIYDEGGAK